MSSNDNLRSVCEIVAKLLQQIIDIELIYYQPIKDKYRVYGEIHGKLKQELEDIELLLSSRSTGLYLTSYFLDDGLENRIRNLWTTANDTLLTMLINRKKFAAKRPKRTIKTSIEQVMSFEDTANRLPFAKYITEEGRRWINDKADNESVENMGEDNYDEWNKLAVVYEKME